MRVLRGSRRLARGGSCAALAAGVALSAMAGPGVAQAQTGLRLGLRSSAVSWGINDAGQLGNGTTADSALYGGVSGLSSGVTQLAAGRDHALALTSDGTVWAWGDGDAGELGNGSTLSSSTPVQVEELTGITAVSAGNEQSLALRSDGTVWAWGENSDGETGNGTTSFDQPVPVQVTGLTGITHIAAGDGFNLALRSDGTVWAWGYNGTGGLGDGSWTDSDVPVQVSGLSQVTAIAAGGSAMAVARRGFIAPVTSVWTWGGNGAGQLGDGTFTSRDTPAQVSGIGVPGGAGVAGIAEGLEFSMVLGSDGSVWAWGSDQSGQLNGFPTPTDQPTPIEVYGMDSGITQIAAGLAHTLALRSDGTVLAWGYNGGGDLGDGTFAASTGVVQVSGLTNATQVSAGWDSSLAIHLTSPIILR